MTHRVDRVLRGVRATLDGNSSVVEDLFTSDVSGSISAHIWSAPSLAVEIEDRAGALADVELRADHARAADDEVWVKWTASALHVGPLTIDQVELQPSGQRIELHGVTVAEFAGDRIAAFHQRWDYAELLNGAPDGRRQPRPQRG